MQPSVTLTIAYLPQASYFQIEMILTYTRKYRILTAIENFLNT